MRESRLVAAGGILRLVKVSGSVRRSLLVGVVGLDLVRGLYEKDIWGTVEDL